MNDLDMIKAFAGLEGVEFEVSEMIGVIKIGKDGYETYNPIVDLNLNCAARDKYEVDIEHYYGTASIQSEYTNKPNENVCGFSGVEHVPRAVIECILKANNLWVD